MDRSPLKEKKETVMSQADMMNIFLPLIEQEGKLYRKYQNIFARVAEGGEVIESITSRGKESYNTARPGDYIVTSQTNAKEEYVISASKFAQRYEVLKVLGDNYAEYRPKGKVKAIILNAKLIRKLKLTSPFYFEAPWGTPMVIYKDDFLVCPFDNEEVYRIGRDEFRETYELDD